MSSVDNVFRAVSIWGFGAQVARGTHYSIQCLWGHAQPHWFGYREGEDWVQRDWSEPNTYGGRDDWRRANELPPIETHPTHRGGECHTCEGEGRESADCEHHEVHDEMERPWLPCPECPECDACDGTGELAWAWEPDTHHGECAHCGAEGVETTRAGEDGEEPACLACVTRWHAESCGCDQWPRPA